MPLGYPAKFERMAHAKKLIYGEIHLISSLLALRKVALLLYNYVRAKSSPINHLSHHWDRRDHDDDYA